jgi:hypothetical protein
MTVQRQGILETAQTLLRAAKTMTDSAIASHPKALLAGDYQRPAEASFACQRGQSISLYRLLPLNASGVPGIKRRLLRGRPHGIITAADELRE